MKKQNKAENMHFMNINCSQVEKARDALLDGFVWANSSEGNDYWNKIYHRLDELAIKEKHRLAERASKNLEGAKA